MVHIYLSYDEIVKAGLRDKYIIDPLAKFMQHGLVDDDITRLLIREIEQGEYCDTTSFYDRFGRLVWMDGMSSGCRTAIACAHDSDSVFDLSMCGTNARDAILNYVDDTSVLLYGYEWAPESMYGEHDDKNKIDVIESKLFLVGGYEITGVTRLGRFLEHEYPDLVNIDNNIRRC
jgi:hypothetical protein